MFSFILIFWIFLMTKKKIYRSWGNYPALVQNGYPFNKRYLNSSFLPYGKGRSYGDSCLNSSGNVLDSSDNTSIISFDSSKGIIEVGSGATFQMVSSYIIPYSFFLPVTPGTQFATIGGGVANDVHGKNHHKVGSFGNHIISFKLIRHGELIECSRVKNSDIFYATIGGLGLTGYITTIKFNLKKIVNAFMDVENIKFSSLEEFFKLSRESSIDYEYLVSWIDCTSSSKNTCKGIFSRGNHSSDLKLSLAKKNKIKFNYPFKQKLSLVNKITVKPFNYLYYNKQLKKCAKKVEYYENFFYPLDSISNWNHIYGSRGFLQHQSLVPKKNATKILSLMLELIKDSKQGSFLVVLKVMGDTKSEGLLSFPSEGVTLAIDFAFRGQSTINLVKKLNDIAVNANGKVYPAKDACMSSKNFKSSYPKWSVLKEFKDRNIDSDFWKRVS